MIDQNIIDRAKKLNFLPIPGSELDNLKRKLSLSFSLEFLELSKIASLEYFSTFPINNLNQETNHSVIGETLQMRANANLPKDTLVLFEEYESLMLMKCFGDHEEIYWMAAEDYYRYCDNEPLEYNPTIFPTFTDFFSYLLDEEEKRRVEEKAK